MEKVEKTHRRGEKMGTWVRGTCTGDVLGEASVWCSCRYTQAESGKRGRRGRWGKRVGGTEGVNVGLGFAAHCERSFLHRTRWGQHSAVCEARERASVVDQNKMGPSVGKLRRESQ